MTIFGTGSSVLYPFNWEFFIDNLFFGGLGGWGGWGGVGNLTILTQRKLAKNKNSIQFSWFSFAYHMFNRKINVFIKINNT